MMNGRSDLVSGSASSRQSLYNLFMFRYSFGLLASAALLFAADADLILRNGKIITVDRKFTIQQAVAVKGEKIVAVGSDAAVMKAERGAGTKAVDLKGKTILPGLVHSHVHPR